MQVLDKNTSIGCLSLSILVGGGGSWVFSGACGGCDSGCGGCGGGFFSDIAGR